MALDDLLVKHKEQWKKYWEAHEKATIELEVKHNELNQAFYDNGVEIPLAIKERIREEKELFKKTWGRGGFKEKQLYISQDKEISTWMKVEKLKHYMKDLKRDDETNKGKGYGR